MVQEIRKIRLSLDELVTAYDCYQRITAEFFPDVTITGCKLKDETVILEAKKEGEQTKEIVCKGLDVLRPLIRFCIENNIMLPRDGKKTILFEAAHVVLHIELNLSTDMPASVSVMQIGHIKDLGLPAPGTKLVATPHN